VELRSKGPGRKGNPPIRDIILEPISYFPIYFYIGYKGISIYEKKFHCTTNNADDVIITFK